MNAPGDGRPPLKAPAGIEEHRAMVLSEARAALRHRGLPSAAFLEDAVQDGLLGLAEAQARYEPDRGVPLGAYARPFVRGAIADALNGAWRTDVLAVLRKRADASAADFLASHTVPEEAHANPAAALEAASKSTAGYLASLGLGYLGAIREIDPEAALLARREHRFALQVMQEELGRLPERDQRVLMLREVERRSWAEIAQAMGAARATVERWRVEAIRRLAAAIRSRGVTAMPALPDRNEDS